MRDNTITIEQATELALTLSRYKKDCALLAVHYTMQDNKFITDNLRESISHWAENLYNIQKSIGVELVHRDELTARF